MFDSMSVVINVLSWLLLAIGGGFVFIGGVGVLRLPNFFTRMHAAGLGDSIGTILILVGIMLQAGLSLATIKLIAILGFLLLTSPTASYALANAALLSDVAADSSDSDGADK